MVAYWLARAQILDPDEYKNYTDRVPAILKKYKGKPLVRGGRQQQLEGPADFERHALVMFPTMEDAVSCFNSPEYREAAAFRRDGAGINELVIVEGDEPDG